MFYRLVYRSRSRLQGDDEDVRASIRSILTVSSSSNERTGITGALLYNGYGFAQVLEGPREAVVYTYGKIQRDSRHDQVTLLEQAYQPELYFENWFMAYVDAEVLRLSTGQEIDLDTGPENPASFASNLIHLLRRAIH